MNYTIHGTLFVLFLPNIDLFDILPLLSRDLFHSCFRFWQRLWNNGVKTRWYESLGQVSHPPSVDQRGQTSLVYELLVFRESQKRDFQQHKQARWMNCGWWIGHMKLKIDPQDSCGDKFIGRIHLPLPSPPLWFCGNAEEDFFLEDDCD